MGNDSSRSSEISTKNPSLRFPVPLENSSWESVYRGWKPLAPILICLLLETNLHSSRLGAFGGWSLPSRESMASPILRWDILRELFPTPLIQMFVQVIPTTQRSWGFSMTPINAPTNPFWTFSGLVMIPPLSIARAMIKALSTDLAYITIQLSRKELHGNQWKGTKGHCIKRSWQRSCQRRSFTEQRSIINNTWKGDRLVPDNLGPKDAMIQFDVMVE